MCTPTPIAGRGSQTLDLHEVPAPSGAGSRSGAGTASARWLASTTPATSTPHALKPPAREFKAWNHGKPVTASLAQHWARMIDMLHCARNHRAAAQRAQHHQHRFDGQAACWASRLARRHRRDRSPTRHLDPPLPNRRKRPHQLRQPHRIDHAQQHCHEQAVRAWRRSISMAGR